MDNILIADGIARLAMGVGYNVTQEGYKCRIMTSEDTFLSIDPMQDWVFGSFNYEDSMDDYLTAAVGDVVANLINNAPVQQA